MYADDLVRPWWDALGVEVPLFDVHTHVGTHDPSGFPPGRSSRLPDDRTRRLSGRERRGAERL
ncbi:hypothetical protein ACWEIJ_36400 [Lentzea sp. NPDC004789]